jgi:hypothetical protein
MFGNRLGWSVSLVIVMVTGYILYALGKAAGVSPPTEFGRNAASYTIALPIDPMSMTYWMTDAGDSGPLYQEAVTDYRNNQKAYDEIGSHRDAQRIKTGMDLLVQAGRRNVGGVFAGNPAHVINYESERTNLEAVKSLARAAAAVAKFSADAGKLDEARVLYEAIFALGAKLYQERLSYWELDVASEPLELGARGLAKLDEDAGEHSRANKYRNFSQQRVEYIQANVVGVRNGIWALEPHVGDMIEIVERGGDPMWRVDAVLALGRCKFSAGKFGDQQGAIKKLQELSDGGEPRIRLAAQAALDLKVEQFRRLR